VYYKAYLTSLNAAVTHLEAVLYRTDAVDAADATDAAAHEFQELQEQTVIALYEPLVTHILGVLQKEGNLIALFESYYADLVAYDRAYAAQYKASLTSLVSALVLLRDANADEYYRVIHEFSMQEYYGVLGGLEKGAPLDRFRAALDAATANGNVVDLAAAYWSFLELGIRPTYLAYLLRDVGRVQRLLA
jgi:hypothetical protein